MANFSLEKNITLGLSETGDFSTQDILDKLSGSENWCRQNKSALDFMVHLKNWEKSFQDLSPNYYIDFKPELDSAQNITQVVAVLCDKKEALLTLSTQTSYVRYNNSRHFEAEDKISHFSRHLILEETVRFNVYPDRFFEAVKSMLTRAVARHEGDSQKPGISQKVKTTLQGTSI